MRSGDPRQVLDAIEKSWKKFNPAEPFEYSFLDQDFEKNYKAESRLAALVRNFMIIAITICCLGLFGLATFSAEQRTKEIGIRKVLGSSVTGIVGLLSKDFVKLVLIGNVVAIPLAWYIMNQWLQEFHFRTPLNWWVFGAAVVLSLAIALLTVSYQALKAALMNPVSALRSE
jgi:putative ABC transport system permease protein